MTTPRVLIIAGSDSGGGAGIQADIKTVAMLGGHAMTAVTAITAQNTLGVQAVMPVPTEMVLAQIDSVISDIGIDAVKIGMLGGAETAVRVAERLEDVKVPIVFDPVMVATSGAALADEATIAAFRRLLAVATVATPNKSELEALAGISITEENEQAEAADKVMQDSGCPAILATGGHWPGGRVYGRSGAGEPFDHRTDDLVFDFLYRLGVDGWQEWNWHHRRIDTPHTHGTGCTLASAIATNLARGHELNAAIVRARQFVWLALREAPRLGAGHGPLGQQQVRLDLGAGPRLNQVTLPLGDADGASVVAFYADLGLTQIVATGDGHYARFEAPGGATLSFEADATPMIFLECEDLDEEIARLVANGISVDKPVEQPWLWREARLTDPAGNRLCLYQADENRRFPPWRIADPQEN